MVARPRKASKIAIVLAVIVIAVFTVIGIALHGPTDSGVGTFHTGDQIAMILLGLLGAGGILLVTRPRVEADADGVRVRNVLGGYQVPWELVRAVRFGRGSPWASLELQDDDVLAVMAVQAADKAYAVATVRGLRALLAAHQARQATPAE